MSNPFGQVVPVTGLLVGFPGKITRSGDKVVATRQVLPSTPNAIQFGQAVVIVSDANGGTYQSVADFIAGGGTMTAALFAGIAVAEVTTTGIYPVVPGTDQVGAYAPSLYADVMERGSLAVAINNGTPASQATVYLRIAANEAVPTGVIGGLEAGSTTGTIALTGVIFRTGSIDSNTVSEITLLNRVAA
jgi:hypothetical protein